MYRTNINDAIITARKHIGQGSMESSARMCLYNAMQNFENGNYQSARMWALKSIAYSVGVFHPDYTKHSATK